MMHFISPLFHSFFLQIVFARIGITIGCFWSRDPPRPPPRDHMVWVAGYYILYIYRVVLRVVVGWVVEWGHETRNNRFCPDPRDKNTRRRQGEKETIKFHHEVCVTHSLKHSNCFRYGAGIGLIVSIFVLRRHARTTESHPSLERGGDPPK